MLANYTELQTAISGHLHRSDLSATVPEFIALFEARMNRHLRLTNQEQVASLSLLSGNDSVALPSRFIEPIGAVIVLGGTEVPLTQVLSEGLDEKPTFTGTPVFYSFAGGNLITDATADTNYTIKLRYIKGWNIAADTTNWLLTNFPDAYLYGSLAAGAAYIADDERLGTWKQLAEEAVTELKSLDIRTRGKAALRMDAGLSGNVGFNINIGY